ncbi:helix-turn-helix domain-containing protein [Brevibacterium aurantiacum]|uniref:helix-turn-helix domain-containing protein n=1 Tax=Brevibacterium aurantiacum TaxID=273384 RepID=UPI000C7687DF|nr:helix-turn-helix domain-containing protein [Brevibacterium aurantiacum]
MNASNRAEVLAGYVAGVPVRELANRFGIHRATVWEIARSAGVDVRRPGLSDKVRMRAARLYAEGMTLAEVAKKLRISNEAVRSAVIARGGTIRPAGRRGTVR